MGPNMPQLKTPQLLVSVRDVAEAKLALASHIAWIDLKEPTAGSLGRPSLPLAALVASALASHQNRSIALGELNDLVIEDALALAEHFPVLKVGLSQCADDKVWRSRVLGLAAQLRTRAAELIVVAYADAVTCAAPSLEAVLAAAKQIAAPYLLIDTFTKDGRGLLDWLSVDQIRDVIAEASEFDCGVVLAGSLKLDDLATLLNLEPAAIAIRGAVCSRNSAAGRNGSIDPERLAEWCAAMSVAFRSAKVAQ